MAAFQAEAEALESSLSANGSSVRFRQLPKADPKVRTAEFEASQAQLNNSETLLNQLFAHLCTLCILIVCQLHYSYHSFCSYSFQIVHYRVDRRQYQDSEGWIHIHLKQ